MTSAFPVFAVVSVWGSALFLSAALWGARGDGAEEQSVRVSQHTVSPGGAPSTDRL